MEPKKKPRTKPAEEPIPPVARPRPAGIVCAEASEHAARAEMRRRCADCCTLLAGMAEQLRRGEMSPAAAAQAIAERAQACDPYRIKR